MRLFLDAGALIAIERQDPDVRRLITGSAGTGQWLTHGGVLGQVWRSPARQVPLAQFLRGVEVRPLDAALGRDAGRLLAESGTSDVVDAALVALMDDGDQVLTSDPEDLRVLAVAAQLRVDIIGI